MRWRYSVEAFGPPVFVCFFTIRCISFQIPIGSERQHYSNCIVIYMFNGFGQAKRFACWADFERKSLTGWEKCGPLPVSTVLNPMHTVKSFDFRWCVESWFQVSQINSPIFTYIKALSKQSAVTGTGVVRLNLNSLIKLTVWQRCS